MQNKRNYGFDWDHFKKMQELENWLAIVALALFMFLMGLLVGECL